jgi:hypothetical protein
MARKGRFGAFPDGAPGGVSSARAEGDQKAVEGAALVVKTLNEFFFGIFADVNMESDALRLEREVDAALNNAKGVLIIRFTGRSPDGAGNYIPEYLGISVAATGTTERRP